MKKVFFKTFGCRTNLFDTQVMIANLGPWETTETEGEADAVVINSCTVTNAADSGVRAYISRLRRERPDAKIFFTGCGVATQGSSLLSEGRIDGLFGHSEKERIETFLAAPKPFEIPGNLTHTDSTLIERFEGKHRAFIKIQEGCDFACSYCIIPTVRGGARSLSEKLILEQIRLLVDQGYEEFVLTGTNMGSYGRDRGENLARLIARIGAISGVKRLRLGSLEPIQVDEPFIEQLSAPFMARHLHIALQHTSDAMLERMNRRNRFESDRALLERLSNLGYALGTDYIVGFPGESEAIFEEGYENLLALPLTHIHLFPYSPREGTPAATLKQDVPGNVAALRRERIAQAVEAKRRAFYARLKTPLTVLIENDQGGLDQYFSRVTIEGDRPLSGWVSLARWAMDESGKLRGSL